MATLNKVLLIGNLTRDPELRYVPSGTAVATFSIAVNRTFTDQTGQKREDTCYIRVIVWGRRAEVCGEYLTKGRLVFVEGRLQSRNWEDSNGQKRSTFEVVANDVQFLGGPRESKETQDASAPADAQLQAPEVDIPQIDIDQVDTQQAIGEDVDVNTESTGEQKEGKIPF